MIFPSEIVFVKPTENQATSQSCFFVPCHHSASLERLALRAAPAVASPAVSTAALRTNRVILFLASSLRGFSIVLLKFAIGKKSQADCQLLTERAPQGKSQNHRCKA